MKASPPQTIRARYLFYAGALDDVNKPEDAGGGRGGADLGAGHGPGRRDARATLDVDATVYRVSSLIRNQETTSPEDPPVGLRIGTCSDPRRVGVSYERGTPVNPSNPVIAGGGRGGANLGGGHGPGSRDARARLCGHFAA